MPSDPHAGTPPINGDGRSPSPGEKRSAAEITDPEPDGGVSTTVDVLPNDSIDDQIAKVVALANEPLKDGQKGYVISSRWVKTLYARSTLYVDKADKESMDSELGPVDNRDIVLDTDPANSNFKYENGELYVPLRPNVQLGQDYEIVPQEAWDLIMKEYGLANQSPTIVRFAHSTSMDGADNIMYELSPPIFTIFKLANPAAGTTPQSLKEKTLPPAKMLAGRQSGVQAWLKRAKELAGINMSTKVRVWKIIGQLPSLNPSTATTPAVSRAVSPAPPSALISASSRNLLVDLNTFLELNEGTQRELLETFKDQTSNDNYNGKMSLSMAGLMGSDVFVLEEQVGAKSGEWVSAVSAEKLKRLGIPINKPKKEITSIAPAAPKSQANSGRSSPDQEEFPFGKKPHGHRMGLTGLSNLGNTCYQNAATQCVRAVEELTYYFLANRHKKDLNPSNPLGYSGQLAKAYAGLIQGIYRDPPPQSFNPHKFRNQIGRNNPTMAGWDQQDSQEFLMFLLDGLSEDLNRILKKPYIEKPDSTDEMVHDRKALEDFAVRSWDIYKARNDSVITDLFAGMYKSTLVCPTCDKVSIIFDPFSSLTLPIPQQKIEYRRVVFQGIGQAPQSFMTEVDKTSTVGIWKESVAAKLQLNPDQLITAEVSSGNFWDVYIRKKQPYEDLNLKEKDVVTFIQLDAPADDRILVPVFNRCKPDFKTGKGRLVTFGQPTILSFTRAEAKDMATIYRKILRHVATMTTRDILGEAEAKTKQTAEANEAGEALEDSDTVVMNEEDAQSADSRINTGSVEGEDSIIDISMHDASRTPSASSPQGMDTSEDIPAHPLAGIFPPGLLSLFDVKVMTSLDKIPTGRHIPGHIDHQNILTRLPSPKKVSMKSSNGSGDESDEDSSASAETDHETQVMTSAVPLLKQSEAILLDWNEDAKDALFGRDGPEDNLRGTATWNQIPFVQDQALIERRAQREARASSGVTLDQCLDEFSREETLSQDDAWYCPRCKEHRQARKKFELWSTPDILVIHLKRFMTQSRFSRAKLSTKVEFPVEELDLSTWVTGPAGDKSLVYDLIGVDNHMGSMAGGHYTAYAKNFITDDWCSFNDSSATTFRDLGRMQSSHAYLLFYRRRSDQPLGGPVLQNIINKFKNGEKDSTAENSRSGSPSGEGKRLGGSFHNGSSSASAAVGAARRAGGGGSGAATPETKSSDDENEESHNPLDEMFSAPSWSFDRAGGVGEMTSIRPASPDEDNDLFGDNGSNVAVDENSDAEARLHSLDNSREASEHEASFEDIPPLLDDGSDEDLPVVELRVDPDEKMHSDV